MAPERLDDGEARIGGGLAVVVDDGVGLELLALVVGDAGLALGDLAGREVEHDRLVARARDADAERVGAEARVAAAERRDDRPRQHVDEVDRDQAVADALLGPVADAAEVMRVGQADDADAVALGALGAELHRLVAHHLAVADMAVEGEQRAAVLTHADVLVDREAAFLHRVDVARHHADAVRVVAAQVGFDQVGRHQIGFAVGRAARLDDAADHAGQGIGFDGAIFSHDVWSRDELGGTVLLVTAMTASQCLVTTLHLVTMASLISPASCAQATSSTFSETALPRNAFSCAAWASLLVTI